MTKLLMLGVCVCFLCGCWGSPHSGSVWSECDARVHLPRDSHDPKRPESVDPYLEACTRVLTEAGYTVVRDGGEGIFASKGEELAPPLGELPRTVQVSARSVPSNLDISIVAKTKRYYLSYERRWTESQRDAMAEMRGLVGRLVDQVDLRYPSPASE